MDSAAEGGSPTPEPGARDYCWIPTMNLEAGMLLARPVLTGTGMHASLHLAAGVPVTAALIAQLLNKGIECVAVAVENLPDPQVHAEVVRLYEARLQEIFGPDPDPACRALYEALVADGPCTC